MIYLASKKNANRILKSTWKWKALLRSVSASLLTFAGFLDSGIQGFRFLKSSLLIMMFFCGSSLFAQRLSLTDVQSQPVTGP
ncbi:MAG: hypothetical protein EBZ78_13450, partial [Verrucomicrobia bacterium]|nr:hypothetical protein [Verrucomicrobiota bacterium]